MDSMPEPEMKAGFWATKTERRPVAHSFTLLCLCNLCKEGLQQLEAVLQSLCHVRSNFDSSRMFRKRRQDKYQAAREKLDQVTEMLCPVKDPRATGLRQS